MAAIGVKPPARATEEDHTVRFGIHMAQLGVTANAAAVRSSARAAETLGYHSVWVLDRLLAPLTPQAGYGGVAGAPVPVEQARVIDPLAVLTFAAAVTERIRLGTSVLVGPWYPPVLLARSLASLDVLSEGRLTVGLGVGWSPDERDAAGSGGAPGPALDELLDVLGAAWGPDPVAHQSGRARIPPSVIGLKPLQRPRPPLLLAASTPAGLDRVARRADGWNPAELPIEALASGWATVRDRAAGYGRDPDALSLVVRAGIDLHPRPLAGDRRLYAGDLAQVADDLEATRRAGAHEVILGIGGDRGLDATLDACAALAERLELHAG